MADLEVGEAQAVLSSVDNTLNQRATSWTLFFRWHLRSFGADFDGVMTEPLVYTRVVATMTWTVMWRGGCRPRGDYEPFVQGYAAQLGGQSRNERGQAEKMKCNRAVSANYKYGGKPFMLVCTTCAKKVQLLEGAVPSPTVSAGSEVET